VYLRLHSLGLSALVGVCSPSDVALLQVAGRQILERVVPNGLMAM